MGYFVGMRHRPAWMSVLILALWAVTARGQSPEAAARNIPTTPINVTADQITTWSESPYRIFFLQGNVRFEQGTTSLTVGRGVIWVDEQRKAVTGSYALEIYGEDGVALDLAGQKNQGPRGLFGLGTSGEVRIKAGSGQMQDNNLSQDPTYIRGTQERQRVGTPALLGTNPNPIQQAQATAPPVLPPPPNVAPVPGVPGPTTPTAPITPPPPNSPPPFFGAPVPPTPDVAPTKPATPRNFSIRPRTSEEIRVRNFTGPNGETIYVVPSPVILTITNPKDKVGVLDIEADRMVFWTRGDGKKLFESMRGPQGETTQQIEFYLAGNVEIRSQTKKETEILRADEVYYDVNRSVAVALQADLEIRQGKVPQPVHVRATEIYQLNSKTFQASQAEIFSTVLPSDPGLKILVKQVTVEERPINRTTIFGTPILDPETGQQKVDNQRYFKGNNLLMYLEGTPIFYFPFLRGDIEDPLGPLENIGIGGNSIFGFTLNTTWNVYELFGLDKRPGTRWRLYLDYMSNRGPAAGTDFAAEGKNLFDIQNRYETYVKAYGIYDTGLDQLGGNRGQFYFIPPATELPYSHPDWRGRFLAQTNVHDLPGGFSVQGKISLLSDQNFLEQFYSQEYMNDLNQETFLYVKQQNNQWAWSILAEPRLRNWVTESQWLPRADGWLLGQKFLDNSLTLNSHASAAYSRFRVTNVPSFAYEPTDVSVDTGRFDLWSELSLPFNAGPFKLAPYVVGDAAFYTADVQGDSQGRLLGGAGIRASIPFSRLYPSIQSDFFNLDSIYHKATLSTNYLWAQTTTNYDQLPQLDRLADDATDHAMRDLRYRQVFINPANATFLTTSPLVDPQVYAIRRLIDSRIDTLDSMNVAQVNLNQRWQTRRGIGASEHIIDWMTLDLGASIFPQANRDNQGNTFGILEYDWVWNIGDRTALLSNGWMEPVSGGPRAFNIGGLIGRYDSSNLYLGYRQIDPLQSRAVIASVAYPFSNKYTINASTAWDFGVDQQTYTVALTRIGTDLQMSLGLSYNSVLQNFGIQFEIMPNLLRNGKYVPGGIGLGSGSSMVSR